MNLQRLLPGFVLLCLVFASAAPDAAAQRRKKKKDEAKPVSLYDIDTLTRTIPLNRRSWHDRIDKSQRGADVSDGKVDGMVYYGEDSVYTAMLTKALLKDVDQIQVMIENLPIADAYTENQTRIRYLTAVDQAVQRYDGSREPLYYRRLIAALKEMIIARHENRFVTWIEAHPDIYAMDNPKLLEDFPEARAIVYRAVGKEKPMMMIRRLKEFASEPYACDVIAAAAQISPNDIYTYASSTNAALSGAVRRCKDPLVMAIVKIADGSKSPLKAMSFLEDIYTGRKTIAEIDKITGDQDLFYKNLVRLKMEQQKLGSASSTQELQYRGLKYVRIMNDLHEESNPNVRFRCIDGFSPEEIYFMLVYGQDEIYTSSFLGAYKRMMERLTPRTGDQLLDSVHYDQFRTFLRMAAGYNTLDNFLASMTAERKTTLMKDFVANLERGGDDELEDAVDVAEAFSSIKDTVLADFIRGQVRENCMRVDKAKGRSHSKGIIVYGLLNVLFNTNPQDSSALGDVAKMLNLPPINKLPYGALKKDDAVVAHFFFYGDEDGKMSYEHFMQNFRDASWKVTTQNENWICIQSTTAYPVSIFANKPVQGENGEDEAAQKTLRKYMEEKDLQPTMIVHRGHSYHLSTTMENMTRPNKIVMLGSCGGYHNLGKVLDRAPDAQIISTKQTGTAEVNDAIIRAINKRIATGQDVDWIEMWNELDTYYKPKGKPYGDFLEYIPPYRNLGAIFIKAYRKGMSLSETEAEQGS